MKHLIATDTKFIAGAKAYRVWLETDDAHLNIGEVLNAHIQQGRRVIVPESRFGRQDPVDIEEYSSGNSGKVAETGKVESARQPGIHTSDDFPDSEVAGMPGAAEGL